MPSDYATVRPSCCTFRAAGGRRLADSDLKVLDHSIVLSVFSALQGKRDGLRRRLSGGFNCRLAAPSDTRFVDVEMPRPEFFVQVELHRNTCPSAHSLMLQQVLQIVERQAKVLGNLSQLPIAQFNPIVVGESCCSLVDPEDDMRAALAQLDEPTE